MGPENGKKPWFSTTGENKEPFIIGIAGGSASGKTSVSNRIIKNLGVPWVRANLSILLSSLSYP